jgi:hypothetical protein
MWPWWGESHWFYARWRSDLGKHLDPRSARGGPDSSVPKRTTRKLGGQLGGNSWPRRPEQREPIRQCNICYGRRRPDLGPVTHIAIAGVERTHRPLLARVVCLRRRSTGARDEQRCGAGAPTGGHQPEDQRGHALGGGQRHEDSFGQPLRDLAGAPPEPILCLPGCSRFSSSLNINAFAIIATPGILGVWGEAPSWPQARGFGGVPQEPFYHI